MFFSDFNSDAGVPDMNTLSHVIYKSRAVQLFSEEELLTMLRAFHIKNVSLGITGMLLYDEYDFFQVIEGDSARVSQLYDAIRKDPRHDMVTTILSEPLPARAFSNWSMGFYKVDNQQLNSIPEMNDFFTTKKCLAEVDLGIAKKLLQFFAFKHGADNNAKNN